MICLDSVNDMILLNDISVALWIDLLYSRIVKQRFWHNWTKIRAISTTVTKMNTYIKLCWFSSVSCLSNFNETQMREKSWWATERCFIPSQMLKHQKAFGIATGAASIIIVVTHTCFNCVPKDSTLCKQDVSLDAFWMFQNVTFACDLDQERRPGTAEITFFWKLFCYSHLYSVCMIILKGMVNKLATFEMDCVSVGKTAK